MKNGPDCLVIGYYEPPFEQYEAAIKQFGERTPAYRDLRFSFVPIGARRFNYVDLMNYAYQASHNGDRADQFASGDIPNLAAVYLTQFLNRHGITADYVNLFSCEAGRISERLESRPTCVAITTTFYVLNDPVIDVIKVIRRYSPTTTIIVGGPLIANHFRQNESAGVIQVGGTKAHMHEYLKATLREIGADVYVNESQGELALANIVRRVKSGETLADVPNIAFWEGSELRMTRSERENNVMDDNWIQWDALPAERIGATVQTRTARSCAFNCSFCNYPTRAGKLALASIDTVTQELDSMRRLGSVKNVVFIDDTFNVPLNRFKDLCRAIRDRGYGFNWFSYLRCSNVDDEAIELMASSGCKGVFLGIESGSPKILELMNKAATIEKYADGIARLREHGILTFGSFIVGFPGETWETVEETVAFIRRHRPDYYRAQLWYCEPGTPIERRRAEFGIEGQGFSWRHSTMDNLSAMGHIEEMFGRVKESEWLPQWSFDFWFIPYILGRGVTLDQFREFVTAANRLLSGEIKGEKGTRAVETQNPGLEAVVRAVSGWQVTPRSVML